MNRILTTANKKDEKILRKKTAPFDFSSYTKKELRDLIANMRRIMRNANGIGLSANQIGLNFQMFVAELPNESGRPKFYVIFNPKLEKLSKEIDSDDEGCLSIPEVCGRVPRVERLLLIGQDRSGKKIKIKAWGLLARIFQHECDHLIGKLFIDSVEKGSVVSTE